MRRTPPFIVLAFTLVSLVTIGCQTPAKQSSSLPSTAPDVTEYMEYAEQVPVWMFIPVSQMIMAPGRGFPAQIALPHRTTFTTNRIEVRVTGQVLAPGVMQLPEGCTLLQAVSFAGGFNRYASTKRVEVIKRDQRTFKFTRYFRRANSGHHIAWYGPSNSTTDYVLEDGDTVYVFLIG
ncbi:MAG: SLBB domain-containing protein [Verrucomicrobiota bacterium]